MGLTGLCPPRALEGSWPLRDQPPAPLPPTVLLTSSFVLCGLSLCFSLGCCGNALVEC